MKKIAVIAGAVVLVALFAMADKSLAGQQAQVEICHVDSASPILYGNNGAHYTFGHLIWVAPAAVPAHLAHGDTQYGFFKLLDEEAIEFLEEVVGVDLSSLNQNADCFWGNG